MEILRTTEFSVSIMKKQIWHRGSLHSGALRLAKSGGKLALPAKCWRVTGYLLTWSRRRKLVEWRKIHRGNFFHVLKTRLARYP